MNYVFIDEFEGEEVVGFVEKNKLVDIYVNEKNREKLSYIYRGRVMDILDGMNAAFIDIGFEKNAFLNLKDSLPLDMPYKEGNYKISDFLKEGEEVIVQVKKDGSLSKGAKVTRHIELSSKNLIVTPYSEKVRVSRKITNREEVNRLKGVGESIKLGKIGMIIRTSAYLETDATIIKEYQELVKTYEKIDREKNFLPCPKLIYKPLEDWEINLIRKEKDLDKIIVKTREKANLIKSLFENYGMGFEKIVLDQEYSLYYDGKVYKDFKKALDRKVKLKSGASIIIDQLEALTAIDVNSEGMNGKKSFRKNILKTNLEAAKEISREIRLRNISGIILIDFINMDKEEDRERIISSLEKEFSKDEIKSNIYGFTKLGILEIARTRKRKSLKEIFY